MESSGVQGYCCLWLTKASYAKGERNENLCDPPQPAWQAGRSKSVQHLMFGIPGVDAGKVDMLPTERRDVLQQSIRNISFYSFQLCDRAVKIDCIPVDDRTDDEVETRGAERLALLNLAYRWFCRLGLEGDVPDRSTFSKNRHGRFRDSDLLRELFETTVRRCIDEGLVGGEGFAVDASLIKADANKQRSAEGSETVDWSAMAETRRSVQEYLDTLDDAAWGVASEVKPKFVSRSDPAAQWTGAQKGHAFFAYATNYLIDMNNAIVDVEASRAIRQAEVGAARTMIERTQDRFDLYPERLAADSAYGSAEMLGWLVHERGIEPHIPVFDKSERRDGPFEKADFVYDHKRDLYTCPGGKELRSRQITYKNERPLVDEDGMVRYRASKHDCDPCALKPKCCPNTPGAQNTTLHP